jgi:NAD(P)-dependent dehydrogenase (short-subunit alcohol dehydrogenase family)
VLIAGAGGLGSACAAAFIEVGAQVMVVDADLSRARAAVATGEPDQVSAASVDLCVRADVEAALDQITARWGGLDVCVHAVGVNLRKRVLDFDDAEFDRILKINLTSAWHLCSEAGRRMTRTGHGRIVLISSVSGQLAHKDHAPYAASKGAMNQMMKVMAAEWAADGVTVNAVAPGYVETELTRAYLDRDGNRSRLESLVPSQRLSTPEEVAGPVVFLASDQARFVTGHVLYVDGGRSLV